MFWNKADICKNKPNWKKQKFATVEMKLWHCDEIRRLDGIDKHKQYELQLLLFKLFISFTDYTYNISIYTNINIFLKYIDKHKQYELLLLLFNLLMSFTDYTYNKSYIWISIYTN
jgi:hypothetical protein